MRATLDHFEIPVADVERMASFFGAVFGWTVEEPPAEEREGERHRRLRSGEARSEAEAASTEPLFRVGLFEGQRETLDRAMPVVRLSGEELETCLERVISAGGRVLLEPKAVGGSGRFAHFEDPEGNPWGLWQPVR